MKRVIITLIIALLLTGCSEEKAVQPDTPLNATTLMKFQIDNQNYTAFQRLFYEGTEDTVSMDSFQQLGELSTAGANYKNYELLTFTNGEMLLVEFAPKLEGENDYEIVDIKIVPEEMQSLFEKK